MDISDGSPMETNGFLKLGETDKNLKFPNPWKCPRNSQVLGHTWSRAAGMWIYSTTNNMEFQQFLLPGWVRARFNPGEVWTEIFPPIQGQDEKLGSFGNSQSWNSTQFHQFHPSFSSYSHPSSWNLDTRIPENIWSFPKKKKREFSGGQN